MFDLFDIAKALEELRMGHREPGVLLGFERGKHRDWVLGKTRRYCPSTPAGDSLP